MCNNREITKWLIYFAKTDTFVTDSFQNPDLYKSLKALGFKRKRLKLNKGNVN